MKGFWVAVLFSVAVTVFPVSSQAIQVGVRGYYWFSSLDGYVQVDEAGVGGTKLDFDQDLGIDDDEFPAVEVFLGGGRHHLSLTYTNIDYSGSKTLTRDITFKGQTYSANSLVTSAIDYDMMDFRYQYDLIDLENVLAGFSVGGVFHVKYLDGQVTVKTTGIDEKEDFNVPIPLLGMSLHLGVLADILEAKIGGTGMAYSGDTMYELVGDVSWTPFPFVDIHGGYRVFKTDIDEDDVILDYDMSGPYVAVTISF